MELILLVTVLAARARVPTHLNDGTAIAVFVALTVALTLAGAWQVGRRG